jgi:hypothetical protein
MNFHSINQQQHLRFGSRRGEGPLAPTMPFAINGVSNNKIVNHLKQCLILGSRRGVLLYAPTVQFAINGVLSRLSTMNKSMFALKGGA